MTPPRPPRHLNMVAVMLISLLVGGLVGFGVSMTEDLGWAHADLIACVIVAAGMAVAFVLCWLWWRGADEAVREAHKWAWWWGGSTGMALGAALLLIAQMRPGALPRVVLTTGPDAFTSGVAAVVGFQIVGYLVAWAWWWWSRR